MLSYHPSGDFYHCAFRLLVILNKTKKCSLELDRLLLMDFYLLFPHLLKDISLPREIAKNKKIFKTINNPFEELPSPKRLFFDLHAIQNNAIRALVAKGILDREIFLKKNEVSLASPVPGVILREIETYTSNNNEWLNAFFNFLDETELYGKAGLKARTGLMEYRYEAT